MTTATDELRKLLEERGVEWQETINHANCVFTWWESPIFGMVHAMDNEDGETLFMACLNNIDFTPEQAIAATLGNSRADYHGYEQAAIEAWESIKAWNSRAERTCHIEERYGNQYCTRCGEMVGTWDSASELYIDGNMVKLWNYCPNCGAKVLRNTPKCSETTTKAVGE